MTLELAHNNITGQLYAVASLQAYKKKLDRKKPIWILTLQVVLSFPKQHIPYYCSIFPVNTITGLLTKSFGLGIF